MEMVNVGNSFYVSKDKLMGILPLKSRFAKMLYKASKEKQVLLDCSGKRSALSLALLSGASGREVVSSPLLARTLIKRFASCDIEKELKGH